MKKYLVFIGCLGAFSLIWLAAQTNPKQEEQAWQWSVDKVKSAVNKVRAGKDLTPKAWPNGAKVAVALSFDFDAETNALRDKDLSPGDFKNHP